LGQKYVWQKSDWPNFTWDSDQLIEDLGYARKLQGQILAQANLIGLKDQAGLLVDEAMMTSAIEGEKLNKDSVRSSVARRLGLSTAGLPAQQRHIDGLVAMLVDATANYALPLKEDRLFGWQAALFPTGYSDLRKIAVGSWRKGQEPMQVVSGSFGREKVHFEAPPSAKVAKEMRAFFDWWNGPSKKMDGILRAGIAHFWFVTIHPFEDGNGRIARAITDMALAQDEQTGRRFYSLSTQISKERDAYYDILETSQKKNSDLTLWLKWFLKILYASVLSSQELIKKALVISRFWQSHDQSEFHARQVKVLNRLLEASPDGFEGGLTNRKYVSLTKVSRETAKRDLAELEARGVLQRNEGKGRSVSYSIILPKEK